MYLITRDNMLEGDGPPVCGSSSKTLSRPTRCRSASPPTPQPTSRALWSSTRERSKVARTFDDPETWTDPHVRHLSVRGPAGPAYRTEPIPDQWELYDLDADPIEAINLALSPERAEVFTALQAQLTATRDAVHEHQPTLALRDTPERSMPAKKTPPRPVRLLRKALQRAGCIPTMRSPMLISRRWRPACPCCGYESQHPEAATGVFGSELTVPYYAFLDAGMEVDVASPRGGDIPFDLNRSGRRFGPTRMIVIWPTETFRRPAQTHTPSVNSTWPTTTSSTSGGWAAWTSAHPTPWASSERSGCERRRHRWGVPRSARAVEGEEPRRHALRGGPRLGRYRQAVELGISLTPASRDRVAGSGGQV